MDSDSETTSIDSVPSSPPPLKRQNGGFFDNLTDDEFEALIKVETAEWETDLGIYNYKDN